MTLRRQLIRLAAFVAWGLALPLVANAQADYPTKTVKIIVPYPAGGTTDVMGRMIADELGKQLKQPFIVENISGAGGAIGMDRAAKATADGYTLALTGVGTNAVAQGLNPDLKYNSNTDFIHISQIQSGPNVLVVHPGVPFKSVKELVAYAKANPGKLDYGLVHAASGHMAMELFKQTAGIYLVGIPYRGGGPMMIDLLGGTIKMAFINQDVALQHVKAGKLRAVAVSSLQRNPLYPDVPTISESGYKGFEAISWTGLSTPKGTPKPIVDKLEAAMVQALQSSAVQQKLVSQGFVVAEPGSKPFTAFVKSEIDRWTMVIKAAGIKPE